MPFKATKRGKNRYFYTENASTVRESATRTVNAPRIKELMSKAVVTGTPGLTEDRQWYSYMQGTPVRLGL